LPRDRQAHQAPRALTPRFPRLGLARLPAAPLRGEEGSVMAGVFRRTINLPASHASQLQPGSDLYASEVHQREKYFPGAAYPPSPLSSPPVSRARPKTRGPIHHPRVSPPALATQPRHSPSPRHLRAKENFLWLPRLCDPPRREPLINKGQR